MVTGPTDSTPRRTSRADTMTRHSIHIPDDPTVPTEPTENEWFGLLASGRRRALLEVLVDRSAPTDVDELTRAVAAREEGRTEPRASAVRSVAISLYHAHLPGLAASGVLEYHSEDGRVEPGPALVDSTVGR